MVLLLALPVFAAVALAYRYLQLYAPSNLLTRQVRAAPPHWRTVLALVALTTVLLIAMHTVAQAIARGAPGWLNMVVLVLAWDAIKFGLLAILTTARATARIVRKGVRATPPAQPPGQSESAGRLWDRTPVRETVGHAPR